MNIEIKKSKKPVKYDDALNFMQERLMNLHINNSKELIWFLQHNDIYTAGTSYNQNEIIDSERSPIKEEMEINDHSEDVQS